MRHRITLLVALLGALSTVPAGAAVLGTRVAGRAAVMQVCTAACASNVSTATGAAGTTYNYLCVDNMQPTSHADALLYSVEQTGTSSVTVQLCADPGGPQICDSRSTWATVTNSTVTATGVTQGSISAPTGCYRTAQGTCTGCTYRTTFMLQP